MKEFFVFILCLLFLSCSRQEIHSCEDWDYPVKPGMEEWSLFQSYDEMVNACQIPENILFCLPTEKLTDLCLQYPPLGNAWAFNFLDDGLDRQFREFNGLKELYERIEVADCLIKRYMDKIQLLSILEGEELSVLEIGQFRISLTHHDALLSRVERKESLKEVLRSLVIGYEAISKLNCDNRFLLEHNFFARAHIIIKMCEQCRDTIGFTAFEPYPLDFIDKMSYQLIK